MKKAPLTPQVQELVLSVMEGLCCPRSLTVAIMLRHGMWHDLLNIDMRPDHYSTADSYRRAACASKFLSKLEARVDGLDPEQAAWDRWLEAEKSCFKTNLRLNTLIDRGPLDQRDEALLDFLSTIRKNVEWLIGSAPPLDVSGSFGPGATVSDIASRTTVPHKMSSIPTLTIGAESFLSSWGATKWAYASRKRSETPTTVRGNLYFTVPKTAKTNRSCAKEPSINAFYQRGYGQVMASRLRQRGLVISPKPNRALDDLGIRYSRPGYEVASEKHRQVAEAASRSNEYATIDLSNASDTLCEALVRAVTPRRWFAVLDGLRSKWTFARKRWYRLEKFSSMGNGFTFELETTIFASICMAVNPCLVPGVDLFVFGDDIIVPREDAANVIAALGYLGFQTNVEKTFISSDFKESCGGDFFRGEPVRPHYLKEEPHEPQDFISLANGISRMGHQDRVSDRLMADLRLAWFRTLDHIPSHIRVCRGPSSLGDLVIHDHERFWQVKYRNQKGYIRVYRPIRPRSVDFERFDPIVQMAAVCYRTPFFSFCRQRRIPLRGDVEGYKVGWVSHG